MATTSALPTFSAIYAFGDSLSDAGNLSLATTLTGTTPVSPPYFQQHYGSVSGNVFSNGPTWVQNLSVDLGLGTLAPSLAQGDDFAYGGAETGSTPQNSGDTQLQLISLPSQIAQFQAAVAKPAANALYTLSIGANDLLDILANPSLTASQQTADVQAAVSNTISFVDSLVAAGAANLLLLDVPDLGLAPDITEGLVDGSNTPSASRDSLASSLAREFNADVAAQLATVQGANIGIIDAYDLIDNAVASPAAFGLTNVTAPVWSGSYSVAGSGSLAATDTATQDQYLFWDRVHPTETGHRAVTSLAEAALAHSTITATTQGEVVPLAAGDNLVFATVPVGIAQSGGASTIVSSAGALTVTATAGSMLVFDSGGGSTISEAPSGEYVSAATAAASTITGAAGGSDTIFALAPATIDDGAAARSLFLGGAGPVVMAAAASATLYAGAGGGSYTPGASSFFLFGGGGADSITGGTASLTAWGNTNERLTVAGTSVGGTFIAFGDNDGIDASGAAGGNSFIVVNEALSLPGGTFSGTTTLVGSSAGDDTVSLFAEGAAAAAHTISIANWQASDALVLNGYGSADVAAANAALAGGGASFTLSDQTTVTFVGAHPSSVA